jgi:GGDEF domain-containing protein
LNIRLTVSVGVATLPDVAATADGLIQAADEAMYWVKTMGRMGFILPAVDCGLRIDDCGFSEWRF